MLRCFIVDDSTRFLNVARVLLEREGVAVVGVASTGAEALERVARLRPDVVLVDVDLGGESGLALAGRLTADEPDKTPSIIMISAYAEEDFADLVAASPAVGFLPKTALSAAAVRAMAGEVSGRRGT